MPVGRQYRLGEECASRQVCKKSDFGRAAQTRTNEVSDLGDDELGDEEGARMGLK